MPRAPRNDLDQIERWIDRRSHQAEAVAGERALPVTALVEPDEANA